MARFTLPNCAETRNMTPCTGVFHHLTFLSRYWTFSCSAYCMGRTKTSPVICWWEVSSRDLSSSPFSSFFYSFSFSSSSSVHLSLWFPPKLWFPAVMQFNFFSSPSCNSFCTIYSCLLLLFLTLRNIIYWSTQYYVSRSSMHFVDISVHSSLYFIVNL